MKQSEKELSVKFMRNNLMLLLIGFVILPGRWSFCEMKTINTRPDFSVELFHDREIYEHKYVNISVL